MQNPNQGMNTNQPPMNPSFVGNQPMMQNPNQNLMMNNNARQMMMNPFGSPNMMPQPIPQNPVMNNNQPMMQMQMTPTNSFGSQNMGVVQQQLPPQPVVVQPQNTTFQPVVPQMALPKVVTSGNLEIDLVRASGLTAADLNGKSDPYCKLCIIEMKMKDAKKKDSKELKKKMKSVEKKSKVKKKTLDPVWNEKFNFTISDSDKEVLFISVFDKDTFSDDDYLGYSVVPLKYLCMNKTMAVEVPVIPKGYLTVKLRSGFGYPSQEQYFQWCMGETQGKIGEFMLSIQKKKEKEKEQKKYIGGEKGLIFSKKLKCTFLKGLHFPHEYKKFRRFKWKKFTIKFQMNRDSYLGENGMGGVLNCGGYWTNSAWEIRCGRDDRGTSIGCSVFREGEEKKEWDIFKKKWLHLNHWNNVTMSYDGKKLRFWVDGHYAEKEFDEKKDLQVVEKGIYVGSAKSGTDEKFYGSFKNLKIYDYAFTN